MKGNRALSRYEVKGIMNLTGIEIRDKALFVLMINTAMRISETLSLRIGDVANKAGNIHGYLTLQAKNTKTHKGASIALNSTARKYLQAHIKKLLARGLSLNDAVFGGRTNQYKKPISRQAAYNIFKKLYEFAGITGGKLACHAPRKTAAAEIYSKTKDLLVCKAVLRHSNIASTMAYLESCLFAVNQAFLSLDYS